MPGAAGTYAAPVTSDDNRPEPDPPISLRITATIGFVGLLIALTGLFLLSRPVRTPTQDCGTVGAFLLDGRTNRLVDPNDPPPGVTEDQARDNNAHPCQERAANRARPAAAALVAGTSITIVAGLTEVGFRWRLRTRRRT